MSNISSELSRLRYEAEHLERLYQNLQSTLDVIHFIAENAQEQMTLQRYENVIKAINEILEFTSGERTVDAINFDELSELTEIAQDAGLYD